MVTGSRITIPAPLRRPPVLTLIGAARTVREQDNGGVSDPPATVEALSVRRSGVTWAGEPCDVAFEPFVPDCSPESLAAASMGGVVTADAIDLWVGVKCTAASLGGDTGPLVASARQLLDIDRHRQLESEFWTGALSAEHDNRFLADDGNVTNLTASGASPGGYALAALQEALAGCTGVGRGMIHCTVQTANLWFGQQLLRREGQILLDVFDNIVIPGVGYDGSGPDGVIDATGETAWAYATGLVDVYLEEPVRIVGSEVTAGDNDVIVYAHQLAAAYWDGCCHFGVNVELCDIACGGS